MSGYFSITFVFTSSSTYNNLLSSTYDAILNCLYLIVIFSMHLSCGLIRNSCGSGVFEYRSYHSIAEYMHPYWAFRSCRYNTFTQLSTRKCFLCLGFTLHMMSTTSPSTFYMITLSSGMLLLRYSLGKSNISTSLPSFSLMMRLVNKSSREIFGEDASSLAI